MLPQQNVVEYNTFYTLPEINILSKLDEVSETLPISMLSNWVKMYVIDTRKIVYARFDLYYILFDFEIDMEYRQFHLMINVDNSSKITKLSVIGNFGDFSILKMKDENDIDYYLIITNVLGLDSVLFDKISIKVLDEVKPLTESEHAYPYVLRVNHTFDISGIVSNSDPSKVEQLWKLQKTNEDIIFSSVFDHLSKHENNQTLQIGDIVFIEPNHKYITGYHSIHWEIYDSFTKKLVFSSTDYALKYRISYHSIFDLVVKLTINGREFKIRKPSYFNSYQLSL